MYLDLDLNQNDIFRKNAAYPLADRDFKVKLYNWMYLYANRYTTRTKSSRRESNPFLTTEK